MSGNEKKFGLTFWYKVAAIVTLPIVFLGEWHNIQQFFSLEEEKLVVTTSLEEPIHHYRKDLQLATISILEVFVLLIILIVGYTLIQKRISKIKKELIATNLKILLNGISLLILSWICFYIWMFIGNSGLTPSITPTIYWGVLDTFKSFISFSSMYCFLLLEVPTNDIANDQQRANSILRNSILCGLVSIFTLLLSIYGRNEGGFGIHFGSLFVAFWGGISLQYLFGKLDSIHLGINRILLGPLYFYSLLQITYILFTTSNYTINICTILLAFGLKIYFFILMIYLLASTNRFNRYLTSTINSRKTHTKAKTIIKPENTN